MVCARIIVVQRRYYVVGGGLGMMYIYFDNAYNGTLWMVFGVGFAISSTVFTLFYPGLAKNTAETNCFTHAVLQ